MSRTTNIYGPRTNKAVARTVKNFNAKRSRELKKDPGAAAWLPEKITTKQIKEENRTRADLNRELKALQQFSKSKPVIIEFSDNLTRTVWEDNKTRADIKRADKSRYERLQQLEPSIERGTLSMAEKHNLAPIKYEPQKLSLKDFIAKGRTARIEAKQDFAKRQDIEYATNYRELVRDKMGADAERILDRIKDVRPAQMVDAYKANPVLNIEFIYDPQELAFIAEEMLEAWSDFLGVPYERDECAEDWSGDLDG